MADVFVSYARADKARVAPVVAALPRPAGTAPAAADVPRYQKVLALIGQSGAP